MKLTQAQEQASLHHQGPALVLAVPGAGKTTVLLHRIDNLISLYGVEAKSILSITFSKAQALDMKERFLARGSSSAPHFSTIHSFAYDIVRTYAKEEKISIDLIEGRNSYNKYSLIKRLYYSLNKTFIKDDTLEEFFTAYSFIKNTMISPGTYLEDYKPKVKNFKALLEAYEAFKAEKNLIDFDDMLSLALKILLTNDRILKRIKRTFKYIQVDEAQDTSKVQIEIIRKVAGPENNLFIVADDDQSIYGFRGASPQDLLNFTKTYPSGKVFFMEENFRSTKNIVDVSNSFIKKNKVRYDKTIVPTKENSIPVSLVTCKNTEVEVGYLVDSIKKDLSQGLEVAVLYRNNISGLALMDQLKEEGVSFYNRDTSKAYLAHFVIEDILNILKLAEDPTDVELYEKVYYKLNSYLKKDYLKYLKNLDSRTTVFDGLLEIPGLKDYQVDRIIDLGRSFDALKKIPLPRAINFIESSLGYGVYLGERTKKAGTEGYSPEVILESLKIISQGLNMSYDLEAKLEEIKSYKADEGSRLVLSTVHSSKGLEFDSVYIMDLVEGEFPSSKSQDLSPKGESEGLEEERRLFYVAMTRAKGKLNLISLKTRNKKPVAKSQFFNLIRTMKDQ